ncbi:WD40 repeat domain-containing protein [Nocardia caishijiensis]|uniref:WD40 repeat protein n=1 Tax=Nocardia caishijiensis TaxID=184756 RepID=A0ABQ6YMY3_9NOCA|nr:WD40 repeat domain-containing protein [Nocardia caishijiensis]KAF0846826.1 WD40 repeat protein [Nocardia caishijiensis]
MNEAEHFRIVTEATLEHPVGRVAASHDGQRIFAVTAWSLFGNGEGPPGASMLDGRTGQVLWSTADVLCFDVLFAPDREFFVFTGMNTADERWVALMRTDTGEQLWTQRGGGFLELAPDGKRLALIGVLDDGAGGEFAQNMVLDVPSGAVLYRQGNSMTRPRFRSDSALLCTGCPSLVDLATATPRWQVGDHTNIPSAAEFTPRGDGVIFASATTGTITTYDLDPDATGAAVARGAVAAPELANINTWFESLFYSPARETLVRVGNQGVALLSVVDGGVRRMLPVPGNGPFAGVFLPRGERLAVNVAIPPATEPAGVSVIETTGDSVVWSDPGHTVWHLAVSGDGTTLVTGGENAVRVYELGTPARSRRDCGARIGAVSASDSAAGIVAVAAEAKLVVFRAATGELMLERVHPGPIGTVAVSPDGHGVVTGSSDGRCRHFDTLTGARWTARHTGAVNAVAVSDDGTRVATAAADRTARLFDRAPGADPENVTELWSHQHPLAVTHVVIGPAASWVATAALDRKVRILLGTTGAEVHPPFEHDAKIRGLCARANTLVTASEDGSTLVIDAATGVRRLRIEHPGPVTVLALAPDGSLLATAGGSTVDLLRIDGDREVLVHRLTARATVNGLAFAANGQLIVSADDSVVAVIDPVSGREIDRFLQPMPMSHLAAGADGRVIVGGCTDNVARVYEVDDE